MLKVNANTFILSMTLYEFNAADELEQLEAVWQYGVLVAEREDEINHYKLYQIDAY